MIVETDLSEQPVLTRMPMRGNRIAPSGQSEALGGRTLQEWQSDHHMVDGSKGKEWIPRHRGGPLFRYVR